jgi:hypothetical protein
MVEGTVDMARRLMEETALRQAVLEKATNMVLEGSLGERILCNKPEKKTSFLE